MADSPMEPRSPSTRPSDPGPSEESCTAPDVNGKRKQGTWRMREHCQKVKTAIREWRWKVWERDFRDSLVGSEIVMNDDMLRRVSGQRRFTDPAVLAKEWDAYELYGAELLDVVMAVNRDKDVRGETAKRSRVAKYAMTRLQKDQAADTKNDGEVRSPENENLGYKI